MVDLLTKVQEEFIRTSYNIIMFDRPLDIMTIGLQLGEELVLMSHEQKTPYVHMVIATDLHLDLLQKDRTPAVEFLLKANRTRAMEHPLMAPLYQQVCMNPADYN